MTPSTYLVTGGAGFIGSNFVHTALRDTDAKLLVLDKLTYAGNLLNLEAAQGPRLTFVRGDICDRPLVAKLLREHNVTALLNFAAETHVDRSIDGPGAFLETNIRGTFELLEAVRSYLAEVGSPMTGNFRFLHVSTDEVYGSLGKTGAFSEETPYAPNSPYAASKASADHWVRSYGETFELPTLITNCSNNYGPYQFPEKLIPLMTLNAIEGKSLPIYGDGGNVRDWLYVEDHCTGILRVLEKGKLGEKYNIGGNTELNNLEVVDRICSVLEEILPAAENEKLVAAGVSSYSELKTFVEDRPGHDRRYAIDCSKMKKKLKWKPAHEIDSGLANTIRWYIDNPEWCKTVQEETYGRERLGLS